MLLKKFAEYLKTQQNGDMFHVVRQNGGGDEESPGLAPAEPVVSSARVVEGDGTLASRSVGSPVPPRFTHFLDGTQSIHLLLYIRMIPYVYGRIGAVVRKRGTDRRMSTDLLSLSEYLYVPFSHIDARGLEDFEVAVRNIEEGAGDALHPSIVHSAQMRNAAANLLSNDRKKLEYELAEEWIAGTRTAGEWLLLDGPISTGSGQTYKHPRIVGVIKSHGTQYFNTEDQMKIVSLKVGERSSIFSPEGKGPSVYSWYLRLHPNEGRDLYFGLVRIEAAASQKTIDSADDISRWLLGERSPLAHPDPRWDRMIYPIHDCEQYLRSIAPSRVMIESALGGIRRRIADHPIGVAHERD